MARSSGVTGSDDRNRMNDGLVRRLRASNAPKSVSGHNDAIGVDRVVDNLAVWSLRKADLADCDCVVTLRCQQARQTRRDVAVYQEPHACRVSGSSRSCTAAAAYSRAAGMSSPSRSGKSSRISASVRPAASCPRIVATGIRKPRMQGTPPILAGSIVIRSNSIC